MSGEIYFISSELDIFAHKPVHSAILGTNVVHYKSIATVDQNDLEFLIPGDTETYIDLDIKLYVKGRLLGVDGKISTPQILRREPTISSILCTVNVASHSTE